MRRRTRRARRKGEREACETRGWCLFFCRVDDDRLSTLDAASPFFLSAEECHTRDISVRFKVRHVLYLLYSCAAVVSSLVPTFIHPHQYMYMYNFLLILYPPFYCLSSFSTALLLRYPKINPT